MVYLNSILQIIRLPNLFMAGIGLIAHWYFLIYRSNSQQNFSSSIDLYAIIWMTSTILLVMAAGYIINDIYDIQTDVINKPHKQFIGKTITIAQSKVIYYILNAIAILVAIVFAKKYHFAPFILFIPISIFLLFLYSAYLKKAALSGNILISFLCILVIWMPFITEIVLHPKNITTTSLLWKKFIYCSVVAWLLSLDRELIKDQQDVIGDKTIGALTLPILIGTKKTNRVVLVINIICLAIIVGGSFYFHFPGTKVIAVFLALILPLVLISIQLLKTDTDFAQQSLYYKIIMAAGMILLPWALSNLHA